MLGILSDLDADTLQQLRYYISPDHPFGPENASAVKEPAARAIFFNQHNMLCRSFRQNPRIIIGRRGSGKTTIISNTSILYDYAYIMHLVPDEIINTVKSITYPAGSTEAQFTESIASIWRTTLNTLLMSYVVRQVPFGKLPAVRAYLLLCDIPLDNGWAATLAAFRRRVSQIGTGVAGAVLSSVIDALNTGDATYHAAHEELDRFLAESDRKAVIIIDSLDDYHLQDARNREIMAGLLKCVGEYGNPRRHIRLCIPGETYFEIRRCSKNALKDLTHNLLLHWLPSEIYSIVAGRYLLYKRLYDIKTFKRFERHCLNRREDVLDILAHVFPKQIKNALGKAEPTLPYIMRHTQLLPRQTIVILNRIFAGPATAGGTLEDVVAPEIAKSIGSVESTLCEEIFQAFLYKYPLGYEYCAKCLTELPRVFRDSDLRKVFNRQARAVEKKYGDVIDYHEFKEMLIEIGAIGRVREQSDIYAEAEFEYAKPGRLNTSVDDVLCLHPLFSGEFRSSTNRAETRVIYPHREWFENDDARSLRVSTR